MCVWCEGAAALGGFAIESRAEARLAGLRWSGSHAEAVAGGLAGSMRRVRDRMVEEQAFVVGPVVAVTLPGRGDHVLCFSGGALARDEGIPDGLDAMSVPASDYAVVNHHRADGDVVDRYGALLGWMREMGLKRDASRFQHREEYPLHADFSRPETVRLMVPVAADPGPDRG